MIASLLVIAVILAGSRLVAGTSQQQYYDGPGGEITGYVIGANRYPVDWAAVLVIGTNHTFQAFSGMSGLYLIRVPIGTYNVTVNVPGYSTDNVIVNVTDGSSTRVDFHLTQSQVAVPEFTANIGSVVLVIALTTGLILAKRRAKSQIEVPRASQSMRVKREENRRPGNIFGLTNRDFCNT